MMIVSLPGVSFGLLSIVPHETYAEVTCNCCGEVFRLPVYDDQEFHSQILEHEDDCPMIELQEALDEGNAKRVRRLIKAAQKLAHGPKN